MEVDSLDQYRHPVDVCEAFPRRPTVQTTGQMTSLKGGLITDRLSVIYIQTMKDLAATLALTQVAPLTHPYSHV